MLKILLCCSFGMSTSMLMKNMQQYFLSIGEEVEIKATQIEKVFQKKPEADVVLLGPQVRFEVEKVEKLYPDLAIGVIPMREYGQLDGKAVSQLAQKISNGVES